MIFRTGQRRHATELHQVDRQLALDNLDVAQDRFRRVAGEPDDIARNNGGADVLPLQQHLTILSDLVLFLLGAHQVVRIDTLEPNKHAHDTGPPSLLDKVRKPVAHGIHLDHKLDVQLVLFAQLDQAVENALPIHVAREIVVGDEKTVDALRKIAANDLLDIIDGPPPRLPALNIDDGAERA